MTVSYQWLLQYLPEPLPVAELSHILTSIGLEVEAAEPAETIKGSLKGLVIGEVLTCERHPNADKLSVTTVTIGGPEILNIVCGAPNVAAGQKVVIAPVGTTVHPTEGESFLIKKAKIRGAESEGMICAEDEIGLGKSHAGIMVLPADAPVGTEAKTYFNIPEADVAIHIGLTPNRSDAMSHLGVARDVCAYLTHHKGKNYEVKAPSIGLKPASGKGPVSIDLKAADACKRYTGTYISHVKVGESPDWLKQNLATIGVRSINNIVDITNFVLHEYGQPLHAFDADKINGNKVVVRLAAEGEKFISLDGKERTLRSSDLMICNENEGMCIAGVFGGMESGVSETTSNIFLESAYFDPQTIRRTSLHHALRTDAATHFEKGVDMEKVVEAGNRAAALIAEIAGGTVHEMIDVYPVMMESKKVQVSFEYINRLCGKEFSAATISGILKALHFEIIEENATGLTVKVPSNKTDVSQPADIAEEVLRIDGLDNIQIPERLNISLSKRQSGDRELKEQLSDMLAATGLQEIVTNSITNSKYFPERTDLVKMINSLSAELDVMRPSMLESGLDVIQYNINRKNADLALFEFGKTYATKGDTQYAESPRLSCWFTGNIRSAQWNQKAVSSDLFFVKGLVESLFTRAGIKTMNSFENGAVQYKWKNQLIAQINEVEHARLDLFEIKQEVIFADIDWNLFVQAAATTKIRYSEVAKFPAVQRDLAIVIDKKVSYQEVKKVTEQLKLDAMQSFNLFDVFESDKLGAGKKSFALNYTFQLQDRTLTDTETEQLMQQLVNAYTTKLEAQIRS